MPLSLISQSTGYSLLYAFEIHNKAAQGSFVLRIDQLGKEIQAL